MTRYISEDKERLAELCRIVRQFVRQNNLTQCEQLIFDAMSQYPHAPEPHNLIGVLLEKKNDHNSAMKHFRAAWALDPTYIPARYNLHVFASLYANGKCAFDESDCPPDVKDGDYDIEHDAHGVCQAIRRNKA